MTMRGAGAALVILVTSTAYSSSGAPAPVSSITVDPVAQTMGTMRIVSTLLVDQQRREGVFPLADSRFHRVQDALGPQPGIQAAKLARDGWGHPLWYRAVRGTHQLISYGADGSADQNYDDQNLYAARFQPVVDAPDPRNDLVLIDARFVRRPFGSRSREFETINAINAIFIASASFAIDNNRYPGSAAEFRPVSELAAELAPTYIQDLPLNDGWGRPLVYASHAGTFVLASFGENGVPEVAYYTDLPCNLQAFGGEVTIDEGGDVVQVCGVFANWPRGTEP
ncbi:MAG: type II secretion system protein GspG [Acidobacteriia bacterium]|nr:type II secretion system protein GspG [Terriglobia bacterium]